MPTEIAFGTFLGRFPPFWPRGQVFFAYLFSKKVTLCHQLPYKLRLNSQMAGALLINQFDPLNSSKKLQQFSKIGKGMLFHLY